MVLDYVALSIKSPQCGCPANSESLGSLVHSSPAHRCPAVDDSVPLAWVQCDSTLQVSVQCILSLSSSTQQQWLLCVLSLWVLCSCTTLSCPRSHMGDTLCTPASPPHTRSLVTVLGLHLQSWWISSPSDPHWILPSKSL